ncbi:hypothetical protein BRADI_2g28095v3 [Brachypodium distachyon]|uniref:Uncharacterized protein n=1 Tax=Brachypodium distachyon TaxID=15368 RepID=A0A0Q3G5V3_BRADI|nr:hypothetical protein BRADI_2g28095v3 [Brachypodium distachyon]
MPDHTMNLLGLETIMTEPDVMTEINGVYCSSRPIHITTPRRNSGNEGAEGGSNKRTRYLERFLNSVAFSKDAEYAQGSLESLLD